MGTLQNRVREVLRCIVDACIGLDAQLVWVGYKTHFTQTCDDDAPQLITHVETTPTPVNDEQMLSAIHTGLAQKALLPDQHLVDSGYVDATNLVESQKAHEVDLDGAGVP